MTLYQMYVFKRRYFRHLCHFVLLLCFEDLHPTAVVAKGSVIKQASETKHEIDDKLTSNPLKPFKQRALH